MNAPIRFYICEPRCFALEIDNGAHARVAAGASEVGVAVRGGIYVVLGFKVEVFDVPLFQRDGSVNICVLVVGNKADGGGVVLAFFEMYY